MFISNYLSSTAGVSKDVLENEILPAIDAKVKTLHPILNDDHGAAAYITLDDLMTLCGGVIGYHDIKSAVEDVLHVHGYGISFDVEVTLAIAGDEYGSSELICHVAHDSSVAPSTINPLVEFYIDEEYKC